MSEEQYKIYYTTVNNRVKGNKEFFVVSDIHGHLTELNKLLTQWNPNTQTLVLLGDYVDRGDYSKEVLDLTIHLQNTYKDKVIVLLGNHDECLLDTLKGVKYGTPYSSITDYKVIQQFTQVDNLTEQLDYYINYLESLKFYHQEGKILFTHAGFNTELDNWQDSTKDDFIWIRNHYIGNNNNTGLINVFGHTPGVAIIGHRCPSILTSREGFIGIDGGVHMRGRLNGIVVDIEGNLLDYYYCRDSSVMEKTLSIGEEFDLKEIL